MEPSTRQLLGLWSGLGAVLLCCLVLVGMFRHDQPFEAPLLLGFFVGALVLASAAGLLQSRWWFLLVGLQILFCAFLAWVIDHLKFRM